MGKSAVKLFNSPSMFNSETTWKKVHAKSKKVAEGLGKSPFRLAGLSTLQTCGKIEKEKSNFRTVRQLALEHPIEY